MMAVIFPSLFVTFGHLRADIQYRNKIHGALRVCARTYLALESGERKPEQQEDTVSFDMFV